MTIQTAQSLNKRNIRQRMRRFAADFSGIYRTELLDPLVTLFLESFGEEIYRIAGEIDNLENRLLDKLSTILVPDIETIAKPACTILHARPAESLLDITTLTEFQHSGFSFYPVCNTRIYKADVRYFIHNGWLGAVGDDQTRTVITGNGRKEQAAKNSFWIGLEVDAALENLSGWSFYLDFHGVSNPEKYLNLLPYTTWKIGGETVSMEKGLFAVQEQAANEVLELFAGYDFSNKINRSVKNKYDSHYLTVTKDFDIRDKREIFPEALKTAFSPAIVGNFNQSLVWLEVHCPLGFTPEIIHSLQISINTFPVVNKQLVSKTVDINRIVPVIPLNTGRNESFISVLSLSDSSGKHYYDIPVKETGTTEYGIYSLRRGGCERYNVRDAMEYLSGLVHSLSGEASAFFKDQNDVKNDLKKIEWKVNGLVRQLNQVIAETRDRYEVENYILIDPEETDRNTFFVQYWVTHSTDAHVVHAGNYFHPVSQLPVHPASVVNLLPAQGGKQAPLGTEKSSMYKQSLSQHCLLITNEDIKTFCNNHFHDFFTDLEIRRGWMESSRLGVGFIRTIDLYMTLRKGLEKQLEQQDGNYFEQLLRAHSPVTSKYRIFINQSSSN
jgi:hypothetical protein